MFCVVKETQTITVFTSSVGSGKNLNIKFFWLVFNDPWNVGVVVHSSIKICLIFN